MTPKNKEDLLKFIESLPNDFEWFSCKEDSYNCINIKVFTRHKDEDFYDWYFGI